MEYSAPQQRDGKQCPVTGAHEWCPPKEGDSRSPCPALNAMANHGYLPHDGRNISVLKLIWGLRACYGLSLPLAIVLGIGAFILLKRITPVTLEHIGKHNCIEHNASLVHDDCPSTEEYAPIGVVPALLDALVGRGWSDEKKPSADDLLEIEDVAKFRLRRENECGPVDGVHAEIARGEMAIALGIWEHKVGSHAGIRKDWLRDWFEHGRLPNGWRPTHSQGLRDTVRRSSKLRDMMAQMKAAQHPVQALL